VRLLDIHLCIKSFVFAFDGDIVQASIHSPLPRYRQIGADMPLTDLVRYLNTRDRDQRPFLRFDDPFHATENGAVAHYARITLDSVYAPIHVGDSGSLHGHAAILAARGELNDQPLHPDAVFAIPSNNAEFVHLDRLVRTLHALNYLLHPEQQHLYVKVNLRHIEIVPHGHGIVFENALRACGLDPQSITLEINVTDEPNEALHTALDAYRERGYRIALATHTEEWQDSHWLLALKPDVVRLDKALLKKPDRLKRIASRLNAHGILSLINVEGAIQARQAVAAGIELIQQPAGFHPSRAKAQHNTGKTSAPASPR
jgi:EAL domain-containing protein (putative c-di-GMP-specific phosphodiesterase class I)